RNSPTLRLRNVGLVAEDVLVNPFSLEAEGRVDLLDAGRLRLERADIAAADLQAFLTQLKHFRRVRVSLAGDTLDFAIEQSGPDIAARLRVVPATDRPFALDVENLHVGFVPVPALLINWVVR